MGAVPFPASPGTTASQKRPFSVTEVARLFGVTVQAIHLWMKSGRLRLWTRTSKRGYFQIPRGEVVRLLKSAGREVPGLWERRRAKVLVIDDDPGVRKLVLAAGRKPAFPMTTDSAPSVEDGLVLAARFLPDVILLDSSFPKGLLSGKEGLAFIRRAALIRKTRVVALVAGQGMGTQFLKAGADAFLEKPFGLAELRSSIYRTLKSALRLTSPPAADEAKIAEAIPSPGSPLYGVAQGIK